MFEITGLIFTYVLAGFSIGLVFGLISMSLRDRIGDKDDDKEL